MVGVYIVHFVVVEKIENSQYNGERCSFNTMNLFSIICDNDCIASSPLKNENVNIKQRASHFYLTCNFPTKSVYS